MKITREEPREREGYVCIQLCWTQAMTWQFRKVVYFTTDLSWLGESAIVPELPKDGKRQRAPIGRVR
jgi:hypothetical protein